MMQTREDETMSVNAISQRSLSAIKTFVSHMSTRDRTIDESLGLNCAWYADILLTLTADAGR